MVFTPERVTTGQWVKRGNNGVMRQLVCHPDGTLTEWDPTNFDAGKWSGEWGITKTGEKFYLRVGGYTTTIESRSQNEYYGYEPIPRSENLVGRKTMFVSFEIEHVQGEVAPFTADYVTSGHWVKRNEWIVRELICHPNGSLTEWDPSKSDSERWTGTWKLAGYANANLEFRVAGYLMMINYRDKDQTTGLYKAREYSPDAQNQVRATRGGDQIVGPSTAFSVEHIIATQNVPVLTRRQYLPFVAVAARYPGRADLPISGPRRFVKAVTSILDELEAKTPNRYKEAVEYLPQANYDPDEVRRVNGEGWGGNSAGVFAVDGSKLDSFFYIFLHEVGHNIAGHHESPGNSLEKTIKEAQAHAYAEAVLRELGRKTVYPDGYNYTRYET